MSADGILGPEITLDGFAGGGGASTGIELAYAELGLLEQVDVAVNHSDDALSMHAANHPRTLHVRDDVFAVNMRELVGKRLVRALWLSPDCKHFSKAKGGKPVEKRIRGLAWVGVKWCKQLKPRVLFLENVEEFQDWGPLQRIDGKWYPDPARKGLTFQRFVGQLRRLGYVVEWRQLRACDYGAPTIRKRLFLIARRDGRPIVWPKPTHGKGTGRPYRTAAECIDWSLPCPSIFERERPLAEATLRRIARGVMRYVVNAAKPFIVPVLHGAGDVRSHGVDEPTRTVTGAQRGDRALVVPTLVGVGARAGQSRPRGGDEPLATITAKADTALVAATIARIGQTGGNGAYVADAEDPLTTITSKAEHLLVAANLVKFSENSTGQLPDQPLHTVMAGAPRHGIVAATMVQTGYGERDGQAPRAIDIEKPHGTVVGGGAKTAVVAAFLAQHNNHRGTEPSSGRAAEEPFSTVTANGAQQQVVTSHLVKLKGTCKDGQPVDEPAPTVQAGGWHIGEVRAFLIKYYGNERDGVDLRGPMHTLPTKDRIGLVTVHGEEYQIVDIGMRMLTPRELARAQGFPDDYVIDRGADGRKLTKTAQVRMIGNSVCPPVAAALVRAQFMAEARAAARRAA